MQAHTVCQKLICSIAIALLVAGGAHAQFNDEHMVIVNRGSANISLIDVATNAVTNIDLPPGEVEPVPGYAVYEPNQDIVFVGDSANSRLVAFDARTYEVVNDNVPVGEGAFHMWGNQVKNQIWTTNPVGMSISVVDMLTQESLGTIDAPMIDGAQIEPHDIILDPTDGSAYVAFFAEGEDDFVIKYNADTFEEMARTPVGKDPHVLIHEDWPFLYVAAQEGQRVEVLDPATLETAAPQIDIFNAHGVTFDPDGSRFFVSSFPQPSGEDSIHTVNPMTNDVLSTIDAPVAGVGPHNLLLSRDRTKMYATHTGADSDFVSIYDVTGESPILLEAVQGGLNPFGIASVPAQVPEPSGLGLAAVAATFCMSLFRRRRS